MPKFRIFETDEFRKTFAKLPGEDADFIQNKLKGYVFQQIAEEPFYGTNIRKLRGYTPDTWRYRIGRFRLFYTVDTEKHVVHILTVDYRRDAYR